MSRVRPQVGPTISLFPFLAVLLCTMGSLLVLLVLFSSSVENSDAEAVAAAAREQAEDLELARAELGWRIDQLEGVRSRTADDLARARFQLAGIEADSRSLVDELDELERTAAALEAGADEADEPLTDLEQRLAAAKAEIDEARQAAAERPPAYAVVPYEGDAGTHRRPLYIECCIDGVFLQPEGIRLGPSDFEGPPGPGNPLASALRAAREHLANRPGESGEPAVQPYPLLLVRPSGVMAYYAARESLQSWGSDFGYQFINEDWTLTFPPPDAALAEAEMRAVEEARRRLEWLAQVRPPKRSKPAVQYRASTTRGGVVSAEGPSVLGDQSRWDWKEGQSGAAGGAARGVRAGSDGDMVGGSRGDAVLGRGTGAATGEGGGSGGAGGSGNGDPSGAGGSWASADGVGGGPGDRFRGPSKFYGGAEAGSGDRGGSALAAGGSAAATGGGSEEASADGLAAGESGGGPSAQPGGAEGEGGDGSGSTAAAAGQPGGPHGDGDGDGAGTSGSAAMKTAGSQANGGGGGSGPSLPGLPQSANASLGGPAMAGDSAADGSCSLAGGRGSNWASLATRDRPIPLTRPIRLECAGNEFRILGEGGRVTSRIPIGTHTSAAVDPLVREVHATVGGWGMAGDRMYWRPELVLSATPDGTGRRDELEKLLTDSGLDTRRPESRDPVRPLPPVRRTGVRSLSR
jgi:hypothetical protein